MDEGKLGKNPWEELGSAAYPIFIKRADLRSDQSTVTDEELMRNYEFPILFGDLVNEVASESGAREEIAMVAIQLIGSVDKMKDMSGVFDDYVKEPINIIQAFVMCARYRVYPPPWVMNDLYERFSNYINSNKKGENKGLGEFFGEKKNSARKVYFNKIKYQMLKDTLCMSVDKLVIFFGISESDAIKIVANSSLKNINKKGVLTDFGEPALKAHYYSGYYVKGIVEAGYENYQPAESELIKFINMIGIQNIPRNILRKPRNKSLSDFIGKMKTGGVATRV